MGYAHLEELDTKDQAEDEPGFDVLETKMPPDAASAAWVIAHAATSHRLNAADVIGPWRYIVTTRHLTDAATTLPAALRATVDKLHQGRYAFVAFSH